MRINEKRMSNFVELFWLNLYDMSEGFIFQPS
jgi:hypothetical protein